MGQRGEAHPGVNKGGDVGSIGDDLGPHRLHGLADGREHLHPTTVFQARTWGLCEPPLGAPSAKN